MSGTGRTHVIFGQAGGSSAAIPSTSFSPNCPCLNARRFFKSSYPAWGAVVSLKALLDKKIPSIVRIAKLDRDVSGTGRTIDEELSKREKFTPICDAISHCATWLAISCNSTFPDVAATPLREDRPRQCRDLDEQSGIIARGNQGVAKGDHAQIYFRPAAEEVGCGGLSRANDACVIATQGKKRGKPARVRRMWIFPCHFDAFIPVGRLQTQRGATWQKSSPK